MNLGYFKKFESEDVLEKGGYQLLIIQVQFLILKCYVNVLQFNLVGVGFLFIFVLINYKIQVGLVMLVIKYIQ